jgi:dihydrofolate reductase
MPKVIGGAFISLDGVVQAPGGPEEDTTGGFAHGGWMEPVFDEAVGHQVDTLFAGDFDLLLGRRTYDIFAAYWPCAASQSPVSALFAKRSNGFCKWDKEFSDRKSSSRGAFSPVAPVPADSR